MARKYKKVQVSASVTSMVSDAKNEVQALIDELTSWRDSLDEKGHTGTDKYSEVSDALDELEGNELPEAPELEFIDLDSLYVEYTEQRPYGKRSPSRRSRLDNVTAALAAVNEKLAELCGEPDCSDDEKETISEFTDEVADCVSVYESIDFPNMI